jgi:hypothetical protein
MSFGSASFMAKLLFLAREEQTAELTGKLGQQPARTG